ncbi:MAG: HlyD family type I secretion periplasmic adaptor subunit [Oceanicaulis sp.]
MISVIWQDRNLRLSAMAVLLVFGGFVTWAALVPLAEGTAAAGAIEVEVERQVVQHLEGGIIRSIHVEEGDRVEHGQPLVELEDLSVRVERDQIAQRAGALDASVQRLDALLRGDETLDFKNLAYLELPDATLEEILTRQRRLFESQNDDLAANLAVMEARLAAARETEVHTHAELRSTREAAQAAADELELARRLVERRMGRVDRVRRLEREAASLRSEIARLERQIAAAVAEQSELTAQATQIRADFHQSVSRELVEARESWLAAREELFAAQDVVNRSVITAPRDGSVFNLRFFTTGGVVRPGEVLLELVPERSGVIATVRIPPHERAQIRVGLAVRASITAYRGARAAPIPGQVESVSADLKTDPDTGQAYYAATIRLDSAAVEAVDGLEILPGMPVQAFIFSGRKRTTLDYLFSPLLDSMFEGLRSP